MGTIEQPVNFCEGCEVACGMISSGVMNVENSHEAGVRYAFYFEDEAGNTSKPIKAFDTRDTTGRYDSTMLRLTGSNVINAIRECKKPVVDEHEVARRRIRKLFKPVTETIRTVQCGAFQYTEGRKSQPYVKVQSDAWKYIEY